MKIVFSGIEKGDTLYVVYVDKNGEYNIGQATVTGFTHWTYPVGDRWETWGERPMTNIDYTFNGIKFSRNLEYVMNNTHFTDSPVIGENYSSVMNDSFVETFTTPEEAKEYILAKLNKYISNKEEQVEKIKAEIEQYKTNINKILK